jgi:Ni2+-binding GTPase involved in maturation of urease and hydrogenase
VAGAAKVNLVTGFLGAGKTSTVQHLLHSRPEAERWAVLVNEFGEAGVDGTLLSGGGAVIQEVAGGCLCCVAAPLFTTGLNRLIRQHRPDRILIEPSGLGHPAQVLETLTGPLYAGVLDVGATLCLLDARQLASPRHREHPNFLDQVHLADVLVANKCDLYSDADRAAFETFAASLDPPRARVAMVEFGRIDPAWLDLARNPGRRAAFPEAHAFLLGNPAGADDGPATPKADWLLIEGGGDGYRRAGWILHQARPWPQPEIAAVLAGLAVERCKGLFLTADGWRALNQDAWSECPAPGDGRSRLELIDPEPIDASGLDHYLRGLDGRAHQAGATGAGRGHRHQLHGFRPAPE